MKIYGKTFLYFGSSLKTVLYWQGEEGKLGGTLERGIVLGDGFELLPHSLLCNLLKNRFQSIKCGPCLLTQKKKKVSLLTVPQILRLFSKSTRLEAPVAWSSSLPHIPCQLAALESSTFSSLHPQCQFLSSSQLSAWLCRTLLPLKKGKKKNGSVKNESIEWHGLADTLLLSERYNGNKHLGLRWKLLEIALYLMDIFLSFRYFCIF